MPEEFLALQLSKSYNECTVKLLWPDVTLRSANERFLLECIKLLNLVRYRYSCCCCHNWLLFSCPSMWSLLLHKKTSGEKERDSEIHESLVIPALVVMSL